MGNVWSDLFGTSKNVFKLKKGKLSFDANSVLANRTVSFGEHDINLATAALGDVLTKTGATTMAFQAPSGGASSFFTLTGPTNMSGTYAGDVYINGAITMTSDVIIHGDLIIDPAGTNSINNAGGAFSLFVKGSIRSTTTNTVSGSVTINLNGTSGATPTNAGSLYVGGDISCPHTITLNGGNRTSGDGVGGDSGYIYINGSVKFCNITANSGNANSTAAGNNHLAGNCRPIFIFGNVEGENVGAGFGVGVLQSTAGVNRSTGNRSGANIYILGDTFGMGIYSNGATANTYSGKRGGNGGDIRVQGNTNYTSIYSQGGSHTTNLGPGGDGGTVGIFGKANRGDIYSAGGDGSTGGFGGTVAIDGVNMANAVSLGGTGNTSSGGGGGTVVITGSVAGDMSSGQISSLGGATNTSGQSPGNGGYIEIHGNCAIATLSVLGGQNNASSRRADAGIIILHSQSSVNTINGYGDSVGPAGRAAQIQLSGGVFREINLTSVVAGGFLKLCKGSHFFSSLIGDSTYTEFKTTFSDDGFQPNVSFKIALKSGTIRFQNIDTTLTEDVRTDTTYIMNNENGVGHWDMILARAVYVAPATIFGTYRGDLVLDCSAGDITLGNDVLVEGNLIIEGANGIIGTNSVPYSLTVNKNILFKTNSSYIKLGTDGVTQSGSNSGNLTVHGSVIGFDYNSPNEINCNGYAANPGGSNGGNGGTIFIQKDSINTILSAWGGDGELGGFFGGSGGNITIGDRIQSNAFCECGGGAGVNGAAGGVGGNILVGGDADLGSMLADGGSTDADSGGNAGTISVWGNLKGNISCQGGDSGLSGNGGTGGAVLVNGTIINGSVTADGGDGLLAGSGGNVTVNGSLLNASSIATRGGSAIANGTIGGNGGAVGVGGDCYGAIYTNGGPAMDINISLQGGNGGSVGVTGSCKGNINSYGGDCWNQLPAGGTGGTGGAVSIGKDMDGVIQSYGGNNYQGIGPSGGGAVTIAYGKLRGSVNCSGGQNLTTLAYGTPGIVDIYDAAASDLTRWGDGTVQMAIGGHWDNVNISNQVFGPLAIYLKKSTHIKNLQTNYANQTYFYAENQRSILFSCKQTAGGVAVKLSGATTDFISTNLYMSDAGTNNWYETVMTGVL